MRYSGKIHIFTPLLHRHLWCARGQPMLYDAISYDILIKMR